MNDCRIDPVRRPVAVLIAAALGSTLCSPVANAYGEETLTVSASTQESAWGPVGSLVAKRSASATKTDTPLVKTPQSVSVVTRDELDLLDPPTIKDALRFAPGVMVESRGSVSGFNSVNIRGFSQISDNIWLDGLKLAGDGYTSFQVDPYLLERVELLRGPASVLYGASDPGGVIALVSKRPTAETLREVQFKMGNHNLYQTGFDFGGAGDDNGEFLWRLTGVASDRDEQQEGEKAKRYSLAPALTWQPNDNTRITLLSQFSDEPDIGWFGYLPAEGTVTAGAAGKLATNFNDGEPGYNKISRRQMMLGYDAEHQFGNGWSLRQNLRYATAEMDYHTIYGSTISASDATQLTRGALEMKEQLSTFSVDTQLQNRYSTGEIDHTSLIGVDYRHLRNDIWHAFGSASNLSLTRPVYGNTDVSYYSLSSQVDHQQQTGVYLQDQAQWQRWMLTLGGRYDWAKSDSVNRYASNALTEQNDSEFSWRGGVNYLFDNGIAPYISYSESFLPTSGTDYYGHTFQASRAKQYEAGVKYMPAEGLISASAAVYQLTKDKNLSTDLDHVYYSTQNGEVRSRGIELEAKAALTRSVDVIASYSYTQAKFTHDSLYQGNQPYEIPKNMASLWGDYTFYGTALSGLTLGMGARYIGSTWGDNANAFKVGAVTVWNTALRYDLARFNLPGSSLGLNVNNLFDKQYVAGCYATTACYYGAERQITGTATFRF